MELKAYLRKHFPMGIDTRTATYLSLKGNEALTKECVFQGYLVPYDNNNYLVYRITEKGKALCDN